jgi:ubiquinone/menaquinone biosynthesis C-methylase UbiE
MTDLDRRRMSFASVAAQYERARPGYPDEAVSWLADRLGIYAGRDVLDLGAGTGKLTRQLVPLGARIVAVEPLDEMRVELQRTVPEATAAAGTAEAIPLPAGSVDVVTSAQAFHWFDPAAALPEIHRVLRSGGGVGLIWNGRDVSDPLQAEISEIVGEGLVDQSEARVRAVVERSGLFGAVEKMTCPHEQLLSRRGVVQRVTSMSMVAVLDHVARDRVVSRVAAATERVPEPLRFAYVTEAYAFTRVD